jgi:hypothetical protein
MTIELLFLPVPGPNSPPTFIPTVTLGTDQAGLIPNVGDSLTNPNGLVYIVKSRNFTFTVASVKVVITCVVAA